VADLSDVLDFVAELWLDVLREVGALCGLTAFCGDLERQANRFRGGDRVAAALLVAHPADEGKIAATSQAEGVARRVDCVRAVGDPGKQRTGPALAPRHRHESQARRDARNLLVRVP
jgi:hypothetical protein